MSDIVQRLRALSDAQPVHDDVCCALAEAADELDRRWREYSMLDEVCAAQAQELERLQADAIHSCSVHCQRVECVQRREIERLRRERDELRAALGTYGRHSDDCDDANAYNGERRGSCGCGLDAALREAGR